MKNYVKNFFVRGAMYAWGGPVILAIVWACLQAAGMIHGLTVNEVVLGIITTTVMAFIAAGVSIVYQIENLPKAFAGLIQMSVLYIDYLGFYLLNGWIPVNQIWMFTLIFVVGFALIWFIIYFLTSRKVNRMNEMIGKE